MVLQPNTVVRTTHSLSIRVGRRAIGAIHGWAPTQARTVEAEFEVEVNAKGLPIDLVPQTMDQRTMRISRYDTYPSIMEEVFGSSELVVLTDQIRPFRVRETWRGPGISLRQTARSIENTATEGLAIGGINTGVGSSFVAGLARSAQNALASPTGNALATIVGAATADIRIYEYEYCYFTDIGRTLSAGDNRVVSVEATLVYRQRSRVA